MKIIIDRDLVLQALAALEYHVEQTRPIWKTSEAIAALEAALAEPVRNEWKEAVVNELITAHIYSDKHDTDPRKAVQDAISWNVQVALDPLVSSDAQALIDRGAAATLESLVQQPVQEPVRHTDLSIEAQRTIGHWLNKDMDLAVANGANSISMPDDLVEIAVWLDALNKKNTE